MYVCIFSRSPSLMLAYYAHQRRVPEVFETARALLTAQIAGKLPAQQRTNKHSHASLSVPHRHVGAQAASGLRRQFGVLRKVPCSGITSNIIAQVDMRITASGAPVGPVKLQKKTPKSKRPIKSPRNVARRGGPGQSAATGNRNKVVSGLRYMDVDAHNIFIKLANLICQCPGEPQIAIPAASRRITSLPYSPES